MRRKSRGVDQTIFKKGPGGLLNRIFIYIEYCTTCGFVLIRIHSYEYILVQCMHNHFVIEATGGCVWALAGCGPLELSSPFPPIRRPCSGAGRLLPWLGFSGGKSFF